MKINLTKKSLWIITTLLAFFAISITIKLYKSINLDNLNKFNFYWIFIAFCFAILQQISTSAISYFSLISINCPARFYTIFWTSLVTTSANSTVPFPAGIPIRAALQKKLLNISYTSSASAMLIETIISYGCEIFVGLLSSILWLRPLLLEKLALLNIPLTIAIILSLIMIILTLLYFFTKRFQQGFIRHIRNTGTKVLSAKISILILISVILLITYSFFMFRISFILYAFGLKVPLGSLLAIMIISHLAGLISFVPMGLGVRDVSLASMLLILNVPLELSAAVVAIDRVLTILPILTGGVFATHFLGLKVIEDKNQL